MDNLIEFQISVTDEQARDDELQAILGTLATELEKRSVKVTPVLPDATSLDYDLKAIEKGINLGSILAVKGKLEAFKPFISWLSGRLAGTTTKVKFTYEGASFEFEGNNDRDRAAAMQDFETFVLKLEALKQAKNG